MKKIIYNWLFTYEERTVIMNALIMRGELDFYQNSEGQNSQLKYNAKILWKKLFQWM